MNNVLELGIERCRHGVNAEFCCQCRYGKIRETAGERGVPDTVTLILRNHMFIRQVIPRRPDHPDVYVEKWLHGSETGGYFNKRMR